MHIILLSGGSGKRLWPLSNDVRSKQFIKIFKNEDGTYSSMLQRVYKQIGAIEGVDSVTIATSKSQVSSIKNQIGDDVWVSVEPCRRDTFPAIALAVKYLTDAKGVNENEAVVVCPVDSYVEDDYFRMLKRLAQIVESEGVNLALMGAEPTYPSEKYGYIIPETQEQISRVKQFKEKPTESVAEQYINQGALWNGGVFAFKLGYVNEKAEKLIGNYSYDELFTKYESLDKISFDYAVVEHEPKIKVLRFAGSWNDLGTWNTLTEAMAEDVIGDAIVGDKCDNVKIVNELDIPILAMGLADVIIAAAPDGIIVTDKKNSSYIKPYVDDLDRQLMFAEKSWGSFRVLDVSDGSMTIKVTLNPGHKMNYHSHMYRDEVWVVTKGTGYAVIDDVKKSVSIGDIIKMPIGTKHTVYAETELQMIEVQIGKEISVQDKVKY